MSRQMREPLPRWAVGVWAVSLLLAGRPDTARAEPSATAFVNVNVLPMTSPAVLRNQTVLVVDGKIAAVGSRVSVPAGAQIVDGNGTAFLSPGLADMHVHSDTAEDMKVFLASGVTSVLNMGDASNGFVARTRPRVNAGEIPGPHVYVAFKVDGSPRYGHFFVTTPDEARWAVHLAQTNGYDLIKVYNDVSAECFSALIQEAAAQRMSVVGHGATRVGLERQLAEGQVMVAHTEEFLYTVFTKTGDAPTDPAPDTADIPPVIQFVRRSGAFVTADLDTFATIARQWGRPDVVDQMLRMPEIRYVSPRWRISWMKEDYQSRRGTLAARLAFLRTFTKDLGDAGVGLIVGTDAPAIPGIVPGLALHDDMDRLVDAGLSPYQVLSAATRTAGEFIRRAIPDAQAFGTVAVGARADLVMSDSNPLERLSVLRKPLGVMTGGHWYPAARLRALLDEVAAEYDRATAPH